MFPASSRGRLGSHQQASWPDQVADVRFLEGLSCSRNPFAASTSSVVGGAVGVDGESLDSFESSFENGPYKLWNGMSSGSYFPPPRWAGRDAQEAEAAGARIANRCGSSGTDGREDLFRAEGATVFPFGLLWIPASEAGGRGACSHARAVLEVRLGSGVRREGALRQHRPRTVDEGHRQAHRQPTGHLAHRAAAQGAVSDAERGDCRADEGNAA